MAEFPALPLWTDAFLGDTTHLTTIEIGAYMLLLMAAWRSEGTRLPDDDRKLARFARLGPNQWARMKPTMRDFWEVKDGWWTQRRLTDEASAVRQRREAAAANGRASALKRKDRHSTKRHASLVASLEPSDDGSATTIPSSVPNGTGAAAPIDPVKDLFDAGVALLTAKGRKEPDARKIIGKWRKARGEAQALAAIVACRDAPEDISEPVSWIEARFRAIAEPEDEADAIRRATVERYRRMDMPGPPPRIEQGEAGNGG